MKCEAHEDDDRFNAIQKERIFQRNEIELKFCQRRFFLRSLPDAPLILRTRRRIRKIRDGRNWKNGIGLTGETVLSITHSAVVFKVPCTDEQG